MNLDNDNFPQGFSGFSWALAALCFPIALWPLALLLSPALLENPNLTETQSVGFSFFFWLYPFALAVMARILYKLQQKRPHLARNLLIFSMLLFWLSVIFIAATGLS